MEQRPLHWSEKAKMFPSTATTGKSGGLEPDPRRQPTQKKGGPKKERKTEGSTRRGLLIAVLAVLVVAAAAAVVLFWYLPSRETKQDVDPAVATQEAKALIQEAMNAVNEAYAQTGTFELSSIDGLLRSHAPDISFQAISDTKAATSPSALAADSSVDYAGTQSSYAIGTVSADGVSYGVIMENTVSPVITYWLNGNQVGEQWAEETSLTDPVDTAPASDVSLPTSTGDSTGQTTTLVTAPPVAPVTSSP